MPASIPTRRLLAAIRQLRGCTLALTNLPDAELYRVRRLADEAHDQLQAARTDINNETRRRLNL